MHEFILHADSHTAVKFARTLKNDGAQARWIGAKVLEEQQFIKTDRPRKAQSLAKKHNLKLVKYEC